MNQYDLTHDLKINVGHYDLYFMVQWFYVLSWRLFDVWTSSLGIMGQYDLKINVCHCDLYFMVHWFCLISQIQFDRLVAYFQIMRKWDPNLDLKNKYRSTWPIFLSLVILLNILKAIWCRNVVLGIMHQCDTKIDLLKYMWVSDLYFMVHWVCLLSLS